MSNESNGWGAPLMVTLTATSNPYLNAALPLRGLLRVHETDTRGYAQKRKVTFVQVNANGATVGTEVAVDDAEFSYTLPTSMPAQEA